MLARTDAKLEPIGEPIRSVDDLHARLRLRAEQLNVSRATIGEIAGLTPGFAEKLLAPQPLKRLGSLSTTLLLGALGVQLVMVEDPAAFKRVRRRLTPREVAAQGRACLWGSTREVSKRWIKRIARAGGQARAAKLSPSRRRKIARRAAVVRWKDVKAATAERKPNGRATNGRR